MVVNTGGPEGLRCVRGNAIEPLTKPVPPLASPGAVAERGPESGGRRLVPPRSWLTAPHGNSCRRRLWRLARSVGREPRRWPCLPSPSSPPRCVRTSTRQGDPAVDGVAHRLDALVRTSRADERHAKIEFLVTRSSGQKSVGSLQFVGGAVRNRRGSSAHLRESRSRS